MELDTHNHHAEDYTVLVMAAVTAEDVEAVWDPEADHVRQTIVFLLDMPWDEVCHLVQRPYFSCLDRLHGQGQRLVPVRKLA